jgi:cell volume regulation protein A
MHINVDNILLVGSLLLLISILVGKTSSRFGVPTLIFFLIVGVMAGSEGIGGINFDDPGMAQFIGVTALNFILFSGGLDTNWEETKPVLWKGITLSTIGVFVTALLVGLFVHFFFGFTILEGLLLGSIVSSTDAAAVFSILKGRNIRLKNNLGPMLELESGSNDPMAYFLTISFTSLVSNQDLQFSELIPLFFREFAIGAAIGYLMGKSSTWIINRIQLGSEGLYPVLMLGLAMFTYSSAHLLGGNGFLAIYLCGVILGNSSFIHKRSMIRFYEGQAWLMQITLFLTLGLLVFPSRIFPVIIPGLLISGFLILIARPVAVFLSLAFFKTNFRSKLFISWVGLRGGVPIVFATYPMIAGLAKSELIFNLVFFISVSSVLLQGTSLAYVARLLHVVVVPKTNIDLPVSRNVRSKLKEVQLIEGSKGVGKQIVNLGIPPSAAIMAIRRNQHYLEPSGSTQLVAGDQLFILADDEQALQKVLQVLGIES